MSEDEVSLTECILHTGVSPQISQIYTDDFFSFSYRGASRLKAHTTLPFFNDNRDNRNNGKNGRNWRCHEVTYNSDNGRLLMLLWFLAHLF